jgi:hypothetical protein
VARKPNYQFERMERDRAKAAKVAEKAAAKQRERDEAAAAKDSGVSPDKAKD